MAILVLAGAGELKLSLPIGAALVVLMLSVGLGYRQVVRAYPHGGGSYIVASDSLGPQWGLLAGAGLIVDYILTVAVSVAAGVAAVTSAIPSVASATVPIGLAVIALLVAGNLRGVRDSAAAFAAPTFMFVAAIALIVIVGLIKAASHGFHPVPAAPHPATEALGVLLVLRAFASGATAMTGIEVISNAVPVFRPPEAVHARQTLGVMVGLLISMFVGVVLVAHFDGASPGGGQTVLSQIAHRSVGSGVAVRVRAGRDHARAAGSGQLGVQWLSAAAVRHGPRRVRPPCVPAYGRSSRVHQRHPRARRPGGLDLRGVRWSDQPADPAVRDRGVPRLHARSERDGRALVAPPRAGWRAALATNLLGAVLSAVVVVIAAITKLTQGAWVVVVLVPLIVIACRRVHDHYQHAHEALTPRPETGEQAPPVRVAPPRLAPEVSARLAEIQDDPDEVYSFAVVPIAALDLAALHALAYAVSLAQPVLAVHVSPTEDEAERFQRSWQAWGDHLPLEVRRLPLSCDSCAAGQLHRRAAPPTP